MLDARMMVAVAAALAALGASAHAQIPGLMLETGQDNYFFGEHLVVIVTVGEVTGQTATMNITDQNGRTSSPITIPITEEVTSLRAPLRFEHHIYSSGMYTLDIEYAGQKASSSFELKDSGAVVVPTYIKEIARLWVDGLASDRDIARGLDFLVSEGIIQTRPVPKADAPYIPDWFKTVAGWWTSDQISDHDMVRSIEYLIDEQAARI